MLIVKSDAPWTTMKEVMDYAKANPGKITVGVAGGSENYLILENVNYLAKINMTPVPFEGGGLVVTALLGGHVTTAIAAGPPTIGHVRAGKIRYLAVTTPERIKWAPNVPTLKELGLAPEVFGRGINFFFLGPKGISKDVLRFIRDNLGKAYQSELLQKVFDDNFLIPTTKTPDEIRSQFTENYTAIAELLKKVKIRP
jgi:tripartite-type tricarboxylate transporter receptor subunit TctC